MNGTQKAKLINEAIFDGIRNAMFEEQLKISTNSGFSMELLNLKRK